MRFFLAKLALSIRQNPNGTSISACRLRLAAPTRERLCSTARAFRAMFTSNFKRRPTFSLLNEHITKFSVAALEGWKS